MKFKEVLFFFLAVNTVGTALLDAASPASYDKLYNNIVKNLETDKTNVNNYKIIEDILNKRNKELKDLYLQSDYVVKPEYLEWQVFFTGFYEEKDRGDKDNHKSNGKEDSLLGEIAPKKAKVGPTVPVKFIDIQDKNVSVILPKIPDIPEVNLNKQILTINALSTPTLPVISVQNIDNITINDITINKDIQVAPVNIAVNTKTFGNVQLVNPELDRNGNGYSSGAYAANIVTNLDSRAASYTKAIEPSHTQTGLIQIIGTYGSNANNTNQPGADSNSVTYSFNNGTNLDVRKVGTRGILVESHRGNGVGIATTGDPNHVLYAKFDGNLTVDVSYTSGAIDTTLAVEIEGGYSALANSYFENAGTIKSIGTGKTIGMEFKSGSASYYGNTIKVRNAGTIDLLGNQSVGIDSLDTQNGTPFNITIDNAGQIIMRGNNSFGIVVTQGIMTGNEIKNFTNVTGAFTNDFKQSGIITLKGKDSYGVVIGGGAQLNANDSLNTGIINVENGGATSANKETSSGIYLNKNLSLANTGDINVSGNYSNGIRVNAGTMTNAYAVGRAINVLGTATESTAIVAPNANSTGINSGTINISSTGGKNIGLYGTGSGAGYRIQNTGANANVNLNITSGSENIGAAIIGTGGMFSNTGKINLTDTSTAGKNIGIYSDSAYVNTSGEVNLTAKGNDVGIYLKNASTGVFGGKISLNSSGNNYDFGVYYDDTLGTAPDIASTFELSGKSAGVFSTNKVINFSGVINMTDRAMASTDSIGLLYGIKSGSPTNIVTNNGTINARKGTGIYVYNDSASLARTITNNSGKSINASEGGVGIAAETKGTYAAGQEITINNLGTISNVSNSALQSSIGIYAKNQDVKVTGSGTLHVESPNKENVGIYVNKGKVTFESNILLGENGIGAYLNGASSNSIASTLDIGTTASTITQNTNTQGIGVVAKGEKAYVNILGNGINLSGFNASNKGSLGVYLENANLDNTSNTGIKVGDYGTGAYLSSVGNGRTVNLGNITTGNNGLGLYLENQNYVGSLTKITTGTNGVGVFTKNGNIDTSILSSNKFDLGSGSVGYFLDSGILTSSAASKTDILFGDNVTGVTLTKASSIDDTKVGEIKIGDKTVSTVQPIALAIKEITSPLTVTNKLISGDGTVGLYYEESGTGNKLTYSGLGNTSVADIQTGKTGGTYSAVGVYAQGNGNLLDINNAYIKVDGASGIGIGVDGGIINVTGGKIELTDGGALFLMKNNGQVNVSSTTEIITPDSGIELFRIIYSNYTNAAGTTLEIPNESIAIHGETGTMINEGIINSKLISGVESKNSIGMYIENTKATVPGILDSPNTASVGINRGKIHLGSKGIGVFGEHSSILNDTLGNIEIADNGAGLYVTVGSIAENKGQITVSDKSVGMYTSDGNGRPTYGLSLNNKLINSGLIQSAGLETIGIYSKGIDILQKSNVINSGTITLTNNAVTGIYGDRTNIENTGDITVGNGAVSGSTIDYSIGILSKDSDVSMQGGNLTVGTNGIGIAASGVNENVEINITGGTLSAGDSSIYTYVRRGLGVPGLTAKLTDTSGGVYDLNKQNQIGIYTEEGEVNSNKTIEVRQGTNSVGLFAKNNSNLNMNISGLTINGESGTISMIAKSDINSIKNINLNNTINLNGDSAVGIVQEEGIVENYGNINVSGNSAVGIVARDLDGTQTGIIKNNGNISVNNELSIGIYGVTQGTGRLEINNTGFINVGAVASDTNSAIGIYGEGNTKINNTGNIIIGENSVGIYGNQIDVDHSAGTLTVGKKAVGLYGTSGNLTLTSGNIEVAEGNAVGIYSTAGNTVNTASSSIINVGDTTGSLSGSTVGSFGIVGKNGAVVVNGSTINAGLSSIGIYGDNSTITNNGIITNVGGNANVSDSRVLIYGTNSQITNTSSLNAGDMGVGIYADNSTADNSGLITAGDTYIDPSNPSTMQFAVGIYGLGNGVIRNQGTGIIQTGKNSIGMYAYTPNASVINDGLITSSSDEVIGMYIENGGTLGGKQELINNGTITLNGNRSVGMSGILNVKVINNNTINVTGTNSVGIYADTNVDVENNGTINAMGTSGIGILAKSGSNILNTGIININLTDGGRAIVTDITDPSIMAPISYLGSGPSYDAPTITNAGIIMVNEKFEVPEDAVIQVKVEPGSLRVPTASEVSALGHADEAIDGKYLISNSVNFQAKEFILRNVKVTPDFSQGSNLDTYKLEDVFIPLTPGGGINYGEFDIASKGILWEATPSVNSKGNLDIWMKRREFSLFAKDEPTKEFADVLDKNYVDATGDALKLYDKFDMLEDERSLRNIMGSLSGNVYANINQREEDMARVLENSLNLLQDSTNNTKENVKINIIAGKGKTNEYTDGVVGYDYTTTGVLALREVERTYRHTFGYSLGYLHTGFEFDDNNTSEEWVDTIQIGGHNKYTVNGWKLRNDLTGRISMHNVDRNIDWPSPAGRAEMNGTYETYSITSDNRLGKELSLGKSTSITPYGGFRIMYVTRPTFEEDGLERVQVEGNDAWSVKPRAGIELKAAMPLGVKSAWQLKGALDLSYEYELANLNEQENARVTVFQDDYYKLGKPEEEEGRFRTKAIFGVEIEDRYGIFINGEYSIGNKKQEDYRAGVTLKAVF